MSDVVVTTQCPQCQTRLQVKAEFVGRNARCRNCQKVFVVSPLVPAAPPRPAAPVASAPAVPSPAAANKAPAALPGDAVGMGTVFRWTGEGMLGGLRYVFPLTVCVLLFNAAHFAGSMLCAVPAIFLTPPLAAGLNLALLGAARRERGIMGRLFSGFRDGRYWPSMGIFWLLTLTFLAAGIPTGILLLIVGIPAIVVLVSKGIVGLVLLAVLTPICFAPFNLLLSRFIWAVPLVVDRRMPVTDALGASWRLTGRVARGFGMFVMLLVLQIGGLVGLALVMGATMAATNVSGESVLSALDPQLAKTINARIEADNLAKLAGESAADYELRKMTLLFQKLEKPLPPRRPNERTEDYARRLDTEADKAGADGMDRDPAATVGNLFSALFTGLAVAGIVFVLLSSALTAVLAMPGMVGYRDMCPKT
jgi:predicted Zn finger-like uncharacterized protein